MEAYEEDSSIKGSAEKSGLAYDVLIFDNHYIEGTKLRVCPFLSFYTSLLFIYFLEILI